MKLLRNKIEVPLSRLTPVKDQAGRRVVIHMGIPMTDMWLPNDIQYKIHSEIDKNGNVETRITFYCGERYNILTISSGQKNIIEDVLDNVRQSYEYWTVGRRDSWESSYSAFLLYI